MGKKHKKKGRKKGQGKALTPVLALEAPKAGPEADQTPTSPTDIALADDSALLEISRTKWQHAHWTDLAGLEVEDVAQGQNRAKLMLLVAAAQGHMGQIDKARASADQALRWGADRRLAASVLLSAVQNSLGRVATCYEDESAAQHFEEAIRLVEPRADIELLAATRRLRENAVLGYLPDALAMVESRVEMAAEHSPDQGALLIIVRSELEQLKHEMSLAMGRGQLVPGRGAHEGEATSPHEKLASRAVSQLGQDLWVLEQTGYKRGGYFVEFGATDGGALSNTWLLEKEFGWTGLLAEPNPGFFKALEQNRSCILTRSVIAARSGEEVEFIFADVFGGIADFADSDFHADKRAAYRTSGNVARLVTVSLDDFLKQNDAPHVIDYLSIDTEGNEYEILAAFPFEDWDVQRITVEHNFTKQRMKIRELLERKGYCCREVEWDDWYEKALPEQ